MTEHQAPDADRIFEELKQEHRRALVSGDIDALERVQIKLDELRAAGRKQ